MNEIWIASLVLSFKIFLDLILRLDDFYGLPSCSTIFTDCQSKEVLRNNTWNQKAQSLKKKLNKMQYFFLV